MRKGLPFKRLVVAIILVVAAVASTASPAWAHNDDCIVAVHVGPVQVHPACG